MDFNNIVEGRYLLLVFQLSRLENYAWHEELRAEQSGHGMQGSQGWFLLGLMRVSGGPGMTSRGSNMHTIRGMTISFFVLVHNSVEFLELPRIYKCRITEVHN